MARISRKSLKHDEFIDAAYDFGEWMEENWKKVVLWVGIAFGIFLIVIAVLQWQKARHRAAVAVFGEGYTRMAGGDALDPTAAPTDDDFRAAAERFGEARQKAGGSLADVAGLMQGAAALRVGDADQASGVLADVQGASSEVGHAAKALIATQHAEAARYDEAAALWREIADGGFYPSDWALFRMGVVFEQAGRYDDARDAMQEAVDGAEPGSPYAAQAQQALERLGS